MNEYSVCNATFLSLKPCQIFLWLGLTVVAWTNHNCPLERKHFSGWCWESDEPMTLAPLPADIAITNMRVDGAMFFEFSRNLGIAEDG